MISQRLENIVVAIESESDGAFVLEKVRALIRGVHGDAPNVHVIRVVHQGIADVKTRYVDQSRELKSIILQAAESELEDILEDHAQGIENVESMALWNANTWEAIVHTAEASQADLIVKASHWEGAAHSIGRTPDDWNLLRHASMPVLLVKDGAWAGQGRVMAAVDAFDEDRGDLGVTVLRSANVLKTLLHGEDLQVVSVYPLFQPWIGEMGGVGSYATLQRNIEQDIRDEIERLAAAADVSGYRLLAEEGPTTHAIKGAVAAAQTDVLVIGTHARDGVRGIVLGNTAEKLLHGVDVDVLVVRG